MPDRAHRETDERPLAPFAWTRRRFLGTGLLVGGAAVLAPVGAVRARPSLAEVAPARGLDRAIADEMLAGRLPGVSAAVVRGDEVVWARGYGYANLWHREPVRRNTLFMVASISKTVVATAVMQAVERGWFHLGTDVNDILPFPVRTPEHPKRPISVRHLLTHTSSIRDRWPVWDDLYAHGDSTIPLGTFLEGYLVPGGEHYRRTNFYDTKPGSRYRYSNEGAALAALLVEVASGVGFDAWCEANIFQPLGMHRAGWHLADVPAGDVAMPYRWSRDEARHVAIGQFGFPDYPAGTLRTTAPQLARHLGMMMNGGRWGGARVLQRATVREMLRSQIPGITDGQGLLWYRTRSRGRTLIGHDGGDKGVATVAFYDRRAGTGVVVLANGNWRRVGARWPLQRIMHLLFDRSLG
jgi:CubicO group peptidase (beta-lactamase class C family)